MIFPSRKRKFCCIVTHSVQKDMTSSLTSFVNWPTDLSLEESFQAGPGPIFHQSETVIGWKHVIYDGFREGILPAYSIQQPFGCHKFLYPLKIRGNLDKSWHGMRSQVDICL
jgi:hypothetical protein